jgi:hypothetical protein
MLDFIERKMIVIIEWNFMKLVLQALATVEVMIKPDTEIVMRILVMMIMGMEDDITKVRKI